MENLHISKSSLQEWFHQMVKKEMHIFAPVHSGDKVDFKRVTSYDEVATDYVQTTQSAKRFAFPKTEVLFSYQKDGKEATLQEADIHAIPETILWKIRPCDAAGFAPLSGIFNWDYKDKLYNVRREKMTLISFSCAQCDESCFCTSVHGGPGNTAGSDIQITELPDQSALVEVLTAKGKALVKFFVKEYTPAEEIDKEQYLASVPTRFNVDNVREKLAGAFDSPVWKQQSERCLGCGACAYVCPTCACFDIHEDAKVRPVIVSVVGILAAFRCLPSIRPDIIRARHKAPVGVSAFCISSPICLNGYRKLVVPDAGVVRVPAR